MTDAFVTLLATGCSILGSIITSCITRNAQKENDTVKMNRERQECLYKELAKVAEMLRLNKMLVFDKNYEDNLIRYLPDVKLIASDSTVEAFLALGSFVHQQRERYLRYYYKKDPRNDPELCDENGGPIFLPSEMEEIFERELREYRKKEVPDQEAVNAVINALLDSLRIDLGTTIIGGV